MVFFTIKVCCELTTLIINAELQIREGIENNLKIIIFFLFLNENTFCDPSLELSRRDGSNDVSQNMFLWRNMDNTDNYL